MGTTPKSHEPNMFRETCQPDQYRNAEENWLDVLVELLLPLRDLEALFAINKIVVHGNNETKSSRAVRNNEPFPLGTQDYFFFEKNT